MGRVILTVLCVVGLLCLSAECQNPVQTLFNQQFNMWAAYATNAVNGSLTQNQGMVIQYDNVTSGGFQCETNIQPLPANSPIPPAQPFELQRRYINFTTGLAYTATMLSDFSVTCGPAGGESVPVPSWDIPQLNYAGERSIDNREVYDFNNTNFWYHGVEYDYMEFAQNVADNNPNLYITVQQGLTTRFAIEGYQPRTFPYSGSQCSYEWVSNGQCQQKATCESYRNAGDALVGTALGWVCGQPGMDCSQINPGGSHYFPNDLYDHADWAFTQYFYQHYASEGYGACCFQQNPPCIAGLKF